MSACTLPVCVNVFDVILSHYHSFFVDNFQGGKVTHQEGTGEHRICLQMIQNMLAWRRCAFIRIVLTRICILSELYVKSYWIQLLMIYIVVYCDTFAADSTVLNMDCYWVLIAWIYQQYVPLFHHYQSDSRVLYVTQLFLLHVAVVTLKFDN